MFYSPLIFLVMVVFFLIALVLLPFLWLGVVGNAFVKLGLSPGAVFWLLILRRPPPRAGYCRHGRAGGLHRRRGTFDAIFLSGIIAVLLSY